MMKSHAHRKRIELEDTMSGAVSQTQKDRHCTFSFPYGSQKSKSEHKTVILRVEEAFAPSRVQTGNGTPEPDRRKLPLPSRVGECVSQELSRCYVNRVTGKGQGIA